MSKDKEKLNQMNQAGIVMPTMESDQTIEPVVNMEFAGKTTADEKFMNEIVEVKLLSTTDENQPPHVTFAVNGINQTFMRDVEVKCRRSFLEVLARCKETKYTQVRDPIELDRSQMVARTSLAYPFQVVNDPNPKGQAWLRAVMAEAN